MTSIRRFPLSRKYFRHSLFDALPSGVSDMNKKPMTKRTVNTIPPIPPQRSPLRVVPVDVVEVAAISCPFVRPKPPAPATLDRLLRRLLVRKGYAPSESSIVPSASMLRRHAEP